MYKNQHKCEYSSTATTGFYFSKSGRENNEMLQKSTYSRTQQIYQLLCLIQGAGSSTDGSANMVTDGGGGLVVRKNAADGIRIIGSGCGGIMIGKGSTVRPKKQGRVGTRKKGGGLTTMVFGIRRTIKAQT
jgi:hypothetical protein